MYETMTTFIRTAEIIKLSNYDTTYEVQETFVGLMLYLYDSGYKALVKAVADIFEL